MKSDATLVKRALSGRGEAFGELVCRWTHRVLALCHALVRHRGAAEELTQEAFARAFVALGSLRDAERFGPWLRGIARRVCLDWLRSRRRPMVLFSQLGEGWTPDDDPRRADAAGDDGSGALEREEESTRLLEELDKLSEEHRTVIMLYYYGDNTYAEIAKLLGVSIATVNVRLAKGRSLLRSRLKSLRM